MRIVVALLVAACSAAAPPPAPTSPPPPATPPPPIDAAAPPDAGLAADAPSWIFRYATPSRTETWNLRFANGIAAIDVTSANGNTVHYFGTITDALAVDVATTTAKIHLDCKKAQRHYSAKCNDTKGAAADALDCFVEGFKEPMTFGPAPGIEFVQDGSCTGYRTIK
ncbi:MAG: hypothetical protein QM831_36920 [Kofleriaceae bacterium]